MAGFRKAKAEQAALKIGLYGPPGSGKSFTSLLLAEGLVKNTGKRIAFVDTERGTDFYGGVRLRRHLHPLDHGGDVGDSQSQAQ
jgi:pantothenate kinase-related protein Tda10